MRFITLDAMRGAAALAILVYHFDVQVSGAPVNPYGYLAVDLFFVLSGFVLTHAYGERLTSGMGFGQFAKLRLIRLYPLYFAGAAIGCVIRDQPPLALLMIPSSGATLYPANGPLWSLVFELIASLVFAGLYRAGRPALYPIWLASGAVVLTAILVGVSINGGHSMATAWIGLARTGFSFCTGIALYHVFSARLVNARVTSEAGWLIVAVFPLMSFLPNSKEIDLVAVFFALPALVLFAALVEIKPSWLAITSGGVSYALYAIHAPIVHMGWTIPPLAVGALIVFFAWVLERFYDVPLRRWLASLNHRRLQRRKLP